MIIKRSFYKRTARCSLFIFLFLAKPLISMEKPKKDKDLYESELFEYRDKYHILDTKTFENSYLNWKKIPTEDRSDMYQATRKISSTLNKKEHILIVNDPIYLEE